MAAAAHVEVQRGAQIRGAEGLHELGRSFPLLRGQKAYDVLILHGQMRREIEHVPAGLIGVQNAERAEHGHTMGRVIRNGQLGGEGQGASRRLETGDLPEQILAFRAQRGDILEQCVVGIHGQILDAEWKFKFLRKLQKDQRSGKRASALRMFGNFKEDKRVIVQWMAAGGEWRGIQTSKPRVGEACWFGWDKTNFFSTFSYLRKYLGCSLTARLYETSGQSYNQEIVLEV